MSESSIQQKLTYKNGMSERQFTRKVKWASPVNYCFTSCKQCQTCGHCNELHMTIHSSSYSLYVTYYVSKQKPAYSYIIWLWNAVLVSKINKPKLGWN